MKKLLTKIFGLFCYMIILSLLFSFNWILVFKPKPFLSVMLGMVILTASQYKKGYKKEDLAVSLRWNLIFASFLTMLISMLSAISSNDLSDIVGWGITESLLPMLYGSIMFILLSIVFDDFTEIEGCRQNSEFTKNPRELMGTDIAEHVFREFNLTNRECHVALKLLENTANKEIASQLYISEATVKKHIQNIYQKFGATDRSNFREIYFQSAQGK